MDEKLLVRGGKPLKGHVTVSGGKNPAVAVIPASLLADGPSTIENLPDIEDVKLLVTMLRTLGARASFEGNTLRIDPRPVDKWTVPMHLVQRMRASSYLIGTLLGRFGKARVALPGGCNIGARPMDQHLKGLRALGANIDVINGEYHCFAERLTGGDIYLDCPTVGGTINIMLAAVRAQGTTTIVNAAKEPHVVDLANYLNAMGGRVKGAGTDIIRIQGRSTLHGATYSILPDQIETGTWMCIAAATAGDITIHNCIPYHMEATTAKLQEMGVTIEDGDDTLRVTRTGPIRAANVKTMPYPGFPTDLQAPVTALLSMAQGNSIVTETIFESRFAYTDQLVRMGARIRVSGQIALVEGVKSLWGVPVLVTDLRAGAALLTAGLMAGGTTTLKNIRHIDRGYSGLITKLQCLGADVERVRD
ncbi:MAG: UDP-N-acetylglucosamine 1-carboxyvinyltransferase [Christensenellales bacterium]|jgi:UDP-N-acetylglucosamine 1-carboxyvinyltransferase